MEWIKAILEKHKAEDGTYNLDAAMDEINQEFPKNAVPKNVYNQTSEDLKAATKLVDDLKKTNKDAEDLQSKITEYETKVTQLETERAEERKTFTIKEALTKAGVSDIEYMMFKLGQVETDKDGVIVDLDNKVKALQEANPTFFKSADPQTPPPNGFKVIDNKLPGGTQTTNEPKNLADAIKQSYEDKQ